MPATLVLLHGRGHEPASMHALAGRLGLDGLEVVAPAAPGGSWYPERFIAPRDANEPHLSRALGTVGEALAGVDPARTILGGFSQGACLAADWIARNPRALGGIAVLCGGLIGEEAELAAPAPGALAAVPLAISGVEEDAWVPVDRVRTSAAAFERAGADVDLLVLPPAPHQVRDEEVAALRRLVEGLGA